MVVMGSENSLAWRARCFMYRMAESLVTALGYKSSDAWRDVRLNGLGT